MTVAPDSLGCLFDGIHGFGLGLAPLGLAAKWTVEKADYPREVLELRVPHAEHLSDVREVTNPPKVRFTTGGFPCQDLSNAGLGKGIQGSRSGLWTEYARIISEVEPEAVFIENVPPLLHRGMELVVSNLVELGYGVEWDCLPAAVFGAPHLRDRVWIVAHKLGAPSVFGGPATLFPVPPGQAVELVGDDGTDEPTGKGWMRWPRAGWVDRDPSVVMPLQPLAPLTRAKSGLLLPTPLAADGDRGNSTDRAGRPTLRGAARLWPTVVASDALGSRRATARTEEWTSNPGTTLLDAVSDAEGITWPTPVVSDYKGAGPRDRRPEGHDTLSTRVVRREEDSALWPTPTASAGSAGPDFARTGRSTSDGGDDLVTAVARLPTPRASDGDARNRGDLIAHVKERANAHHPGPRTEGRENEKRSGALNPPWVEWLMGFPLGWTDVHVLNDELVYHPWTSEPHGIPRVAANVLNRRDRLTALGNALVPNAPAWVAARYLTAVERTQ